MDYEVTNGNSIPVVTEEMDGSLQPTRERNGFVALVLGFLLLLSLFLAVVAPKELSRGYLDLVFLMIILAVGTNFLSKLMSPKPINWFSVENLFVVGFCVVHFWYYLVWRIGLVPSTVKILRDDSIVCYAAMLSVSGLIAFLLGFNVVPTYLRHSMQNVSLSSKSLRTWKNAARFIFLVGVTITIIYVSILGKELTEGQYTGSARGGYFAKILLIVLNLFLIISLVVLSISSIQLTGKYKIGLLLKIILPLFLLYLIILGSRSVMVVYAVVLIAAYTEYYKPMSLKLVVIGVVLGFLMMNVGLIGRLSPERTLKSFIETAMANKDQISVNEGALELGGSVRCLNEAVSIVKNRYGYLKGRLKLSELLSIIPFYGKIFTVKSLEYTSSSLLLTWTILGSFDSGVGTTVIADIYLDFGYPGVVVFMCLLGMLCKYIQQKARYNGSMIYGVAHCCLIATVTLMPRFTYLSLLRGVLWPILILLILRKVLGLSHQPLGEQIESFDLDE